MRLAGLCVLLLLTTLFSAQAPGAIASEPEPHAGLNQPDWSEDLLRAILTGRQPVTTHPRLVSAFGGYMDHAAAKQLRAMLSCLRNPDCSGLEHRPTIRVCSTYRSHRFQRDKWRAQARKRQRIGSPERLARSLIRWLALPGASRHHWGTDVDLSISRYPCMLDNHHYRSKRENQAYCERAWTRCKARARAQYCPDEGEPEAPCDPTHERALTRCNGRFKRCDKGQGRAASWYAWLREHAHEYGFCQPYRDFPERRHPGRYETGYAEENWHWSYCCQSQHYLDAYRERLESLRPSFDEVYGNTARLRGSRAAHEAAFNTELLTRYEEHLLNVHPSCEECRRSCAPEQLDKPSNHDL